MADQRTMAELLRAPTEGYVEAIVVPPILAEHFELKHSLTNMMTSDQFFELDKDNPHDHIRWFNKITSTIKYKDVPNSAIKLMLFPFSLAGAARRWVEKEPLRSILTWEDLAWDHYKDLLRACPHHGFTELHQLDTFCNALNPTDQDSLNSTAGGNLLERRSQDVLAIIENKSKGLNHQTSVVTTVMTAILKQFQATPPPASVKAVEEICLTCGGAHPYYQCLAADGNTFPEFQDNIQGYVSAAAEMDSILEDSVDECNLADPNNDLVDTIPEMFTNENTLDYSSPPLYYDVDDDLVKLESNNDYIYDDPFDSKEDKIKESKLLIDKLDPPRSSDFLPSPEYDSVLYEDFFKVDALPSTNNEDKVFSGILIHENLSKVTVQVTPDKNEKKISISNASLILEDFNRPLYELPFHKEFSGSETLLSFSSENEEKVFNTKILTSKGVHTSLLSELSHRALKLSKSLKILKARWRFLLALMKRTSVFWMFRVSISILHEQLNSGDFLDFEDSCLLFYPSITRSSHPQLHFGNPIS
nr:hypothetical protein [Tanacetum cinerariifolium]